MKYIEMNHIKKIFTGFFILAMYLYALAYFNHSIGDINLFINKAWWAMPTFVCEVILTIIVANLIVLSIFCKEDKDKSL